MKRIFALLILVTGLFSCGKELSEENGNSNVAGNFRGDIDGQSWVADRITSATRLGGFITLYGGGTDHKSISLEVADSGVHSYQFVNTSLTNVAVYQDSAVIPIAAWSTNQWFVNGTYGDLNITRIDTVRKKMSGTFSINVFRALDGLFRNITNGSFTDISYTGTDPVAPLLDTFEVKNDGVAFTHTRLDITQPGGNNINISASQNLAPEIVNITFPDSVTPGDYPFGTTVFGIYNSTGTTFYSSLSGTLTVLENNTVTRRVRGNFNFIATGATPPDHAFTEGYFAVSY